MYGYINLQHFTHICAHEKKYYAAYNTMIITLLYLPTCEYMDTVNVCALCTKMHINSRQFRTLLFQLDGQ